MTTLTAQINTRQLTTVAPLASEFICDPNKNYLFDLSYLSGIHVEGDKAQEFLQGQLSCDLRDVHLHQMRQGALCDLKGRILALLDVVNWDKRGFQLILPQDLLLATQASLAKTALFSRVTLHPASTYTCFGFHLQNTHDLVPFDAKLSTTPYEVVYQTNYCCYGLGNHFYIFLIDNTETSSTSEPFIKNEQWRGSLAWHALQLQQKRVDIYPESSRLFLPHRLGLQLSGYLNFNKGCYKGQEIIARMHYRAKLKHELKIFTIEIDKTLGSGQKIMSETGLEEIGELIDYCPLGNGKFIIAASMVFEHAKKALIENQLVMLTAVSET